MMLVVVAVVVVLPDDSSAKLFLMLNKNCTEPYLGPLHTVYKLFILIKIIVQFFECKIPERVLVMFSKASHLCEAKMCGLSLLAIFTL